MIKSSQDSYVPLRVRSCFSLLKGVSTLDALLEKSEAMGYAHMALTDENNLYGAWPLSELAQKREITPISGCILSDEKHSLIALVENQTGYSNLCRLISQKHLKPAFNLVDAVSACCAGLFFLIRNPALVSLMVDRVDKERLWLECCRPMSTERELRLWSAAKSLDLPVVATTDVFYAQPEEQETRRLMTAVRKSCLMSDVAEERPGGLHHLPSPAEMKELFADHPEAVSESVRLAARCQFVMKSGKAVFPCVDDAQNTLKTNAYAGALLRFGELSLVVEDRLEEELSIIIEMGFADYFLIVADIVTYARSLESPVAGRGSGANSLVAYCLNITNVDPLQYDLPFARFLNRGRPDYPDFDLEFCWQCRDRVIDYVFQKHGADYVAMISAMVTMKPRMAFRMAAKVLGFSRETISRIQRVLAMVDLDDLDDPGHECWSRIGVSRSETMQVIAAAKLFFYKPHHLSLHPGGIVIAPEPITQLVPLERATKGVVMTQFDKRGVEKAGLVKIDLLGNRSLSMAGEAMRLMKERHGRVLEVETLCEEDGETSVLLKQGRTLGVGQLESPSMRRLLCQLQVGSPRDIMQALALIRPGAASLGMKPSFVRRARGLEEVPTVDPRLDSLLRDTYGIMLFEDDAMLVACALTGCDVVEGDHFRRRIRKASDDSERLELSKEFLALCNENGVRPSMASDLWVQMAKFNSYSFCRAHAASYARLAWFNSYVKTHYPLEFWIAALNNNEGLYDKWVYVEEAKREGIRFLLPCVNRSEMACCAEGNAIRIGLAQVKGLSRRSMESILTGRPFGGIDDLVSRSLVNPSEVRRLILCGALNDSSERASYAERFRQEWDVLGLSVREHPVKPFRTLLVSKGFRTSGALSECGRGEVRLCGVPATSRSIRTDEGEDMCFLTLSDEDGLFEVCVDPGVFSQIKMMLAEVGHGMLCVMGIPENRFDVVTVHARKVQRVQDLVDRIQ